MFLLCSVAGYAIPQPNPLWAFAKLKPEDWFVMQSTASLASRSEDVGNSTRVNQYSVVMHRASVSSEGKVKCFLGLTTLDRSHKLGWLKLLDNRGFALFLYIVRIQICMIRVVQSIELRLFSIGAKCKFKSKSLQSKFVFLWSQRGTSDLQSGGPGFESHSGHLLDLLSLALSSNPRPRL